MNLLRSDLDTIPPYVCPTLDREGTGWVRLHMNEAPADWPPRARDILLQRLAALPFRCYPERQAELTERLRMRLGAPEGGLLLGPSSGNLLDLVALAGLAAGDAVAVPDPGFGLYALLAQRHGGRLRKVPVGGAFPLEPWFQALEEGLRQLWITLPNNPTGAWIAPEALEPLLAAAARRPAPPLVVLDEAYAEFAPATQRLAVDRFPNVLILRTFSKALASAGWRLGCLLGCPDLVRRLASLQLPYAISAPALEALDVALDFAADFEGEIQALRERRERLRESLGAFQVPPSAANFLYVSPDPAPRMREAGLQARAFPGSDAARISIGSEAETVRTAQALGGCLPDPVATPPRRLLVLDVDGVMIDAEQSFMDAVARALADLALEMEWSGTHFRAFKRIGGFNNDFRLAAGALALAGSSGLDRLEAREGTGFPELEDRIAALEPRCREAVQRHYGETRALERPLITLAELRRAGCELAIFTGRPPEELALAFEVLGFELPAVCDRAPHLRKPRPEGLLQLADAFRAQEVVFVGDTRDDAEALAQARDRRPDLAWTFAAVGPEHLRIARPGDLSAPTLRDLLPALAPRPDGASGSQPCAAP